MTSGSTLIECVQSFTGMGERLAPPSDPAAQPDWQERAVAFLDEFTTQLDSAERAASLGRLSSPEPDNGTGELFTGLIKQTQARVRDLGRDPRFASFRSRIDRLAKRLDLLLLNHERSWIPEAALTESEVAELVRRGEAIPLDEAFAQIAGMDKATWLAVVDEHQRARERRSEG
jgi:hypothetical protein